MSRDIESWGTPGDLLHAALQNWIVVEISDATLPRILLEPELTPRREPGIQRLRAGSVAVSEPVRTAR